MLSVKPWRLDAIARLFVSVLVCMFAGSVVASLFQFFALANPPNAPRFLGCGIASLLLFGGALYFLNRQWNWHNIKTNLLATLACVYGAFGLAWWAGRMLPAERTLDSATLKTAIAVLSFQGAALILVHFFLRAHQVGWSEGFGLKNDRRKAFVLGAFVLFSVLPVCWLLQMASVGFMQQFNIPIEEQTAVRVLRTTDIVLNRVVLGTVAILIVPVAEEIIFRGILYPAIKQAGFPRLAVWITSVVFALIHFNVPTFLPLLLLALVLTWLYEKTDNLLAPVTLHSLFNAANFAMLYGLPWLADKFPKAAPATP